MGIVLRLKTNKVQPKSIETNSVLPIFPILPQQQEDNSEGDVREDSKFLKHLKSVEKMLRNDKMRRDDEAIQEKEDIKFKFAALVMDRFFFFVSVLYFIIAFACIIMPVPNFYKLQ